MDPHLSPQDTAVIRQWLARVRKKRVPLSGSIELTPRCNFRCVHCYVDPRRQGHEITTDDWYRIIDEAAAEGCLWMLVTGGEPLLHPDFVKIYEKIKRTGMFVSVFSNGAAVTDEHCELFKRLPPWHVEISVYGATEETYEAVTGVRGGLKRCLRGIERLKAAGIRVDLKTVVLTINDHELEQIDALAKRLDCRFRLDGAIFARLDGDRTPLDYRVSPERTVELEFANDRHVSSWVKYYSHIRSQQLSDRLYDCGAGVCMFHVTSTGRLQPCISSTEVQYDLLDGTFAEGWNDAIPRIWKKDKPVSSPCTGCDLRPLCGTCPPVQEREADGAACPAAYYCTLGKARLDAVRAELDKQEETEDAE